MVNSIRKIERTGKKYSRGIAIRIASARHRTWTGFAVHRNAPDPDDAMDGAMPNANADTSMAIRENHR
ncbi:hypothetical protein [Cupriavidus respiraculi]|uniref:hypothetical protein n=1 Tax=Cupriavidus respiraculi TaxID=195930 RepID=UPI001CC77A9D|nr:hypothetical protein [Cupriavidus respiraculi]